ncbi:EAL domain-containing protein [Altererythrobacter sp. HHU K3-1]|uniref:EAL domain-containing protein n=2 Tax=Qipengyuania atrilutea TaxID=2744473 RepID=A0A850H2T5_9SPHN|nr:EAL domain-containing protein [Actirhodobacter atriluteus]
MEGGLRDPLTGLANADDVHATLAAWQANAARRGSSTIIHAMMVSLQRIDTVNVAYGESAGDGALIETARRITHFADDELSAGGWIAARISGGNFLVASLERCSRERWQWLAEALADAVALPVKNIGGDGTARLWPRITLLRAEGETSGAILDRLAGAFAESFEGQARRIAWVNGVMPLHGRSNAQLEADLIAAIDRDEIEIVYQPQYAVEGDRLIGAEALARWQHGKLGLVGAATLFTLAERADHVAQLSRHLSEKALSEASSWPSSLRLSLNITPTDLASANFARDFLSMLGESGFSPDRLTLEITEQMLLADLDQVATTLEALKAQGVNLALDDFGAGFCNFRYLKVLPIDLLKLDRSMIDGILNDQRDLSVFRAILAMAQALDLSVLAEGVENEAQRDLIAREGCAYYQGFLRSKPMTAFEFAALG